jgi:hypothetical protein
MYTFRVWYRWVQATRSELLRQHSHHDFRLSRNRQQKGDKSL